MGEDVVNFDDREQIIERNVGAIVVATGSSLYDCTAIPGLGYGKLPDIYTSLEFERILSSSGPTGGEITTAGGAAPKSVAIIHCVGSLDPGHRQYCSGICCQSAFKFNHLIESKLPEAKVYHLYRELVIPGKEEFSLYRHATENENAALYRYGDIGSLSVTADESGLKTIRNSSLGKEMVAADMVILCPAVVPAEGSEKLGAMLEVSRDRFGFFEELHGRLDAAQSKIKGVYLAGTCQAPMDIQKSVLQGMAAAGYVLSGLAEGKKLEIEPITAAVDEERCAGCRICVSVCPYKAIGFDGEKEKAEVNAVLCHGCGTCVSACPAGAITGSHFTNEEIMAEIGGVLA
jgi:heterodisulfide reductase subunit A